MEKIKARIAVGLDGYFCVVSHPGKDLETSFIVECLRDEPDLMYPLQQVSPGIYDVHYSVRGDFNEQTKFTDFVKVANLE